MFDVHVYLHVIICVDEWVGEYEIRSHGRGG